MVELSKLETVKAISLVKEGGDWDARKLQLAIMEWKSNHETKDWHEFSDLLCMLEGYGMVKHVGFSDLGLSKFRWVE